MRLLLILGLFAVAGLFSLRAPVYAACLFLWNNIFQPLSFARSPAAFPAAQAVLAVLVGSYALHIARGKLKPRANWLILYSPVLLGWILVTALVSPIPHAMEGFVEILKYLLPLFFISIGLRSIPDIKILSILLTLSVGVWSAQAGVHGLVKGVTRDMAIEGGQMTDNNDFMAATVSILPMLLYLAFSYRGKFKGWAKAGGLLIAALSVAAIVFSGSRGAALGLAASAMLYVALVSRKKLRDGLSLVAIVSVVLLFLPDAFWERMSTIRLGSEQTEGSAQERMHMMTAALGRGRQAAVRGGAGLLAGGGGALQRPALRSPQHLAEAHRRDRNSGIDSIFGRPGGHRQAALPGAYPGHAPPRPGKRQPGDGAHHGHHRVPHAVNLPQPPLRRMALGLAVCRQRLRRGLPREGRSR